MKKSLALGLAVFTGITMLLAGCGGEKKAADNKTAAKKVDYPTKNISMICPWGAGGGTDRRSPGAAGRFSQYRHQRSDAIHYGG